MRVVIDTSSLLSLVRYYLPFDKKNKLFEFIKDKISSGELIIIDAVLEECSFIAKRIVIEKLDYLIDKDFRKAHKFLINTKDMLPPSPTKFYNQIDNEFVNKSVKNILSEIQYESEKRSYLSTADARLIIYCLNLINDNPKERVILVTEESEGSNDHKTFKKIPAICKILSVEVKTLPNLIEIYDGINFEFK